MAIPNLPLKNSLEALSPKADLGLPSVEKLAIPSSEFGKVKEARGGIFARTAELSQKIDRIFSSLGKSLDEVAERLGLSFKDAKLALEKDGVDGFLGTLKFKAEKKKRELLKIGALASIRRNRYEPFSWERATPDERLEHTKGLHGIMRGAVRSLYEEDDFSFGKIFPAIERDSTRVRLNVSEIAGVIDGVSDLDFKKKAVSKAFEKAGSPKEMFAQFLGREPKGQVEVVRLPASIGLLLGDEDFDWLARGREEAPFGYGKSAFAFDLMADLEVKATQGLSRFEISPKDPSLRDSVFAVRADSPEARSSVLHEEAHTLSSFLTRVGNYETLGKVFGNVDYLQKYGLSREDSRTKLGEVVSSLLSERFREEMLPRVRTGGSFTEDALDLRLGYQKYLEGATEDTAVLLKSANVRAPMEILEELGDSVRKERLPQLEADFRRTIEVFDRLGCPREDTYLILSPLPFDKWRELADGIDGDYESFMQRSGSGSEYWKSEWV